MGRMEPFWPKKEHDGSEMDKKWIVCVPYIICLVSIMYPVGSHTDVGVSLRLGGKHGQQIRVGVREVPRGQEELI